MSRTSQADRARRGAGPAVKLARLGGGFASQALSSATNFLLSLLVLRSGSLEDFGWFTLVVFVYLFGVNVGRAVAGTPLLLSPDDARSPGPALGVAACLGAGLAVVVSPLLLLLPGDVRPLGLAMCVALPFALVQDAQRFSAFARDRPLHAAALDAAWLAVFAAAVGTTDAAPVTAWTLGAVASAVSGALATAQLRPSFRRLRGFLSATAYWRNGLLAEAASSLTIMQLSPYLIALVVGVGGFGALRGAYTVMAPINVLMMGLAPVLLRTYQQTTRERAGDLKRLAALCAAGLGAAGACYTVVVAVLPTSVLVAAFGPAAAELGDLLVPVGVMVACFAIYSTSTDALRGLRSPRWIAVIRTAVAAGEVVGAVVGGLLAGVHGAAVGGAAFVALAALLVAVDLLRAGLPARPSSPHPSAPTPRESHE